MKGRKKTGTVDGGAGRGVPMGGRDTGRGPTGHDAKRSTGTDAIEDDDETTPIVDENFDEFFEDEDSIDRRRDPLRKP